jgi:predicted phage terminase large subunit-like protein
LRELVARSGSDVHLTRGRTTDNADHIAPAVMEQLMRRYAGTRLGRQELEAELLTDFEGSLWRRTDLDSCHITEAPEMASIVVAIDPAMTGGAESDETGIVAAGRGKDGLYYVLADRSGRYAPDVWARQAVHLAEDIKADCIVAEINAGGDLVEEMLKQIAPRVPFKAVRAIRSKLDRALPIASLYEQGSVWHVGPMEKLEDQMARFAPELISEKSPDRVDALVWALTALSDMRRADPKIRSL